MSSAGYETRLAPDSQLRRTLVAGLVAADACGLLLLAVLPVPVGAKLALVLLWLAAAAVEARRLLRGMSRIDRIVMSADGGLRGGRAGQPDRPLELLPGSVVLERWAWLRLRFEDGLAHGELLRRASAGGEAWRRLTVIWRHARGFRRPRRSC